MDQRQISFGDMINAALEKLTNFWKYEFHYSLQLIVMDFLVQDDYLSPIVCWDYYEPGLLGARAKKLYNLLSKSF